MFAIQGSNTNDLAMCYFKSPNDKEASGWIYLKDVREIADDLKLLTIITTSRKIVLEAGSRAEHRLWLQGLIDYSPYVTNTSGIQSDITLRSRVTTPVLDSNAAYRGHSGGDDRVIDQRARTFSRHADTEAELTRSRDYDTDRDKDKGRDRSLSNTRDDGRMGPGRDRDPRRYDDEQTYGEEVSRYAQKKALGGNQRGGQGSLSASSATSRLHSHISRNNSSSNMANNDSANTHDRDRDRDSKESGGIETDYTSLSSDKFESARHRLRNLVDEDDGRDHRPDADADAKGSEPSLAVRTDVNSSTDHSGPNSGSTGRTPVSHFQTESGATYTASREAKLSVDDMLSRGPSSGRNSANGKKAPPLSSYSPRVSADMSDGDTRNGIYNDDDDDEGFDLSVSITHKLYTISAFVDILCFLNE